MAIHACAAQRSAGAGGDDGDGELQASVTRASLTVTRVQM
jgi:hypothetical protein